MKQLIILFSALTLALSPNLAKAGDIKDILEGGQVIESSSFQGENGHTVSGGVKIIKKGDIQYLVLESDFLFDGAPDPKLGFSKNGEFTEASLFSGLNQDQGTQIYRLPVDFDAANYDEVTIWCDKFDVSLAEAKY